MIKLRKQLSVFALATAAITTSATAAAIFGPTDAIVGGASDGTNFTAGVEGFDALVNNWPTNEPPSAIIDGVGQKYLNFARENTGVLVTPDFNGGSGSIVNAIQMWAANDSPPRDPGSFELWGTNNAVGGGSTWALSDFTLVASGPVTLPDTRNDGGVAPLDDANSQTINFGNSAAYTSYLVLFPTVKDSPNANSMQVAEVQLHGNIPEPGAIGLLALSSALLMFRRRRA